MSKKDEGWFKNRVEIDKLVINGRFKEVIYEVVTGDDNAGFGFAVADIDHSQMHIHNKTTEVYILVSGDVYIQLGKIGEAGSNLVHLLRPGDTVTIPPNTHHYAISARKESARVAVLTIPAWSPDDHILTGLYADTG